jgi:O-antigen/teichoic acid export membrane protein
MVQSTVVALTSLSSLGLGVTATKYVSEYRTKEPERAGRILGLSSLIATVAAGCFSASLLFFARALALGNDETGVLEWSLRLGAIYVFFITMNGYQAGALAGLEAFGSIARISMIFGPANVMVSGALSFWLGLKGAVLAQAAGAALLWSLYHYAVKEECRTRKIAIHYRDAWQERSILIRFSVPAAASGMAASVAMWGGNAILVKASGYAELALFTALVNIRSLVLFLPALITRVASPVLNNLLANGDLAGYRRIFARTAMVNSGLALLLATLIAATAGCILRLFGKDFVGGNALVLILLISVVLEVLANSLFQAVFTTGSLWWGFATSLVWTAILIGITNCTASRWGASGLAFAYLAAWCATVACYGALAWQQMAGARGGSVGR